MKRIQDLFLKYLFPHFLSNKKLHLSALRPPSPSLISPPPHSVPQQSSTSSSTSRSQSSSSSPSKTTQRSHPSRAPSSSSKPQKARALANSGYGKAKRKTSGRQRNSSTQRNYDRVWWKGILSYKFIE